MGSPQHLELLAIHVSTEFELPAPQLRQTHSPCPADTHSPGSPHRAQLDQIRCTESISTQQSSQPAPSSHLMLPELFFDSLETSLHIYLGTPQTTPKARCLKSAWPQIHPVCEAAIKHPQSPTCSRALVNDSFSFPCTPSKWLTGFL